LVAHYFDWHAAFLAVGLINLAGAFVVRKALPKARHFVRAASIRHSVDEGLQHLRNPRLLAVFGMGFSALFTLVGVFTYANFYLAAPPFQLNTAQLGSIFFVYLLGFLVTPLSGRCLDHYGIRSTAILAFCCSTVGLLLTMVLSLTVIVVGLAIFSTGVFIFQAVGTVQVGIVAGRACSSAAGLYVTLYYMGGSLGAIVTGWIWVADGWRACALLLIGVAGVALLLALVSSTPAALRGSGAAGVRPDWTP
jgi:predicted MFS family arabinose efflux permease